MAKVDIGLRIPHGLLGEGPERLARFAHAVEDAGIDRVWTGDHISFRGGTGYDGLLSCMALAAVTRRVTLQSAVYLLPLRHPLPVARQVAQVAELAPGRFVFGVGIGGDDRSEPFNCGVDPATRGRRADESLPLIRRLLAGEVVDQAGEYFALQAASIRPVPKPGVPIVVGGRAPAALRRAGRFGDGWLGVWVTPERFSTGLRQVEEVAVQERRDAVDWQHGMLVWCGFGRTRDAVRPALADAMQDLYQVPFERFERHSPCGTPDDVAGALLPYVSAGARSILLAAVAADEDERIEGAARVRALLRAADA